MNLRPKALHFLDALVIVSLKPQELHLAVLAKSRTVPHSSECSAMV